MFLCPSLNSENVFPDDLITVEDTEKDTTSTAWSLPKLYCGHQIGSGQVSGVCVSMQKLGVSGPRIGRVWVLWACVAA